MYNIKCLTSFAVYSEYKEVFVEDVLDDELVGDRIYYSPEYVVQIKATDSKNYFTFNPLQDTPYLYLELAKINSDQDLMKFAQIFGLPFGHDMCSSDKDSVHVTILDTITFYKNLSYFKNLLQLWFANQNHEEFSSTHSSYLNNITFNSDENVGSIIANVLNEKKTWKETYMHFDNNSSQANLVSHCVMFKNLLETAYFQLSRVILNNTTLRRCNECNEIFEVAHESQKFCPPKLGRKRSTCENTHKVRKKRQKQKLMEITNKNERND